MDLKIINVLKNFGIEKILELEREDIQFKSISLLKEKFDEKTVSKLVMFNSLITYKLVGKGEEHWMFFANYFLKNKKDFFQYIKESPFLILNREKRIERIKKVYNYNPDINDLEKVWIDLSSILKVDKNSKTIVFTIKMLNYVYRIFRNKERILPKNIPIPVDLRVIKLTKLAGLINSEKISYKKVQEIWNEISEKTNIPPLHLDSILWLAGRIVIHKDKIYNIPKEIIEIFTQQ
ncbi:MAG: N-glycosylase/DNA lyase [Candidatus Aenigmatarchaeota archaeon]